MRFRAHKPNYMTGFEELDHVFMTKEELLEAPQVKRFATSEGFHRFSLEINEDHTWLMCEQDEGYKWWVCGFIKDVDQNLSAWFPKWEAKYR